jgi:hypothetical protein
MVSPIQRVVLVLGAGVILMMALFPPWTFVYNYEQLRIERFAGYHAIWMSNSPTDSTTLSKLLSVDVPPADLALVTMKIDTTRLTIQIVAIILVALLIYFSLSGKRNVSDIS